MTGSHQHKAAVKLTKGAQQVFELLRRSEELKTAQDIHGALRNHLEAAPGLTTVYRSLDSLVGLGYVQSVDLGDGEKRYEVVKPGEHHHHLICDRCKKSVHLDRCLVEDLEDAVRKLYGFQIRDHVLEMFGVCRACATSDGE
jgi:Fur family transcriptional regulator, ferric uptake regulator